MSRNVEEKVSVFPGAQRADMTNIAPDIVDYIEDIRHIGYTVIPDFLDSEKIEELSSRIDQLYAQQLEEFGAENLAIIKDEGVCRSLFAYDDAFIDLIREPLITKICRHFLGQVFILNVQRAVLSASHQQHGAAVWHREPAYQNFTSSVPIAITSIFILDGSSAENGGVHVLEASHKFEQFPSDAYVLRHQKVPDMPPGSLLLFDSALFHRGGYNTSGKMRRSIVQIHTSPLIKQATDIPRTLLGRLNEDPELKMLLGYTTAPAENDIEYRQGKLDQQTKSHE